MLAFSSPYGEALPLMLVTANENPRVVVQVQPFQDSVDHTSIVESSDGLYSIIYTPTVSGAYDINVWIAGADVSTDLTKGVMVAPAQEYAATSTHNISQVNVKAFGNILQYNSVINLAID